MLAALAPCALLACGEDPHRDPGSFAGAPLVQHRGSGLTAQEKRHAVELARADPVVREATDDSRWLVAQIGPWGERDLQGRQRFVGATILVRFDRERTMEMRQWPAVDYARDPDHPCTSIGHYEQKASTYRAENVTGLMIDVDLNEDRVAGISPAGNDLRVELDQPQQPKESYGC